MLGRAVPAGAGRQPDQKRKLREEFQMIAGTYRRRLHEILPGLSQEAGAHEDVQHVMHIGLGLDQRQAGGIGKRAREVRVAAMVVVAPRQEPPGIGIAARSDHVMHAAPEAVESIPVERVAGDRRHRPQPRERGPEPVAGRQMRAVERAGLAGIEPLVKVVGMPEVQVAHLRPLGRDDAEEPARWNPRASRLSRRHEDRPVERPALARRLQRRDARVRERVGRIADDRLYRPAGCGVGGGGKFRVDGLHCGSILLPDPGTGGAGVRSPGRQAARAGRRCGRPADFGFEDAGLPLPCAPP